jgi:hypothetical protein
MKGLRCFALGMALIPSTAAFAQDDAAEPDDPNTGAMRVTGGIDITTAYFFRGYLQEDQGIILQPFANLYFDLSPSVSAYVGTWNSLHEEQTGAPGGTTGNWYESDFYTGVDIAFGEGFTLGALYTAYTYPSGIFDTVEEIGVKLAWDDTDRTGLDIALKPYAAIYFETDDDNGSEDTYLELGVAPTVYTFNEDSDAPIAVAVPVAVGFGIEDYYFDDTGDDELLGYGSIGIAASMPLPMPAKFGDWSLNGSVTWLQLFAEGLEAINNGDDNEIIAKIGVSFAY